MIRALLSAALGALAALGQAPWDLWPLTLTGLAGLGALVARGGAGFAVPFAFAAGHFLVALSWLVEPFLVDAARDGWMAPFGLAAMAGGLALFWGAAGLGARIWGGVAAFPLWLALAEIARGYVLTGFPWAMPAHVWTGLPVRHLVAWTGTYGLNALTLGAALWLGLAAARRAPLPALAAAVAALPLMLSPLLRPELPPAGAEAPRVRIVQPNVPQREKWDPARIPEHLRRLVRLSTEARGAPPDIILWPETAPPVPLSEAGPLVSGVLARARASILGTGILRAADDGRYYNSLAVFAAPGRVVAVYDKHHLVPFGEYLPFPGLARRLGLRGLAERFGGMKAGTGPALVELGPAGPALPLVCYEAIFPQNLRGTGRPRVLVQVTNDAWFGTFSGPYQHLAQARLRAAEQGLPLLRAANTGISAVIDASGELVTTLPLGTAGVIDARLPPALPPTAYSRLGDAPVAGLLGLLLAGLGLAVRRRRAQLH